MGKWVGEEAKGRIAEAMFKNFKNTPAEVFLRSEFERYIPQFTSWSDEEITDFIDYQRAIWLEGKMPVLGKEIACLNPAFVANVDSIKMGDFVYTRAAVKENGYRFQLHNGLHESNFPEEASAFTRQFTPYDLRMFPELDDIFPFLPVMIGDAELINKKHKHLAGFNRVQERIPNVKYWPNRETGKISDELLEQYLKSDMFINGKPTEDFEMTLAFHGLFAISRPDTWEQAYEIQRDNLISFCRIPMNYSEVDEMLDRLAKHIEAYKLNARVAERVTFTDKRKLKQYVQENEEKGLEGTVVVQYAEHPDGTPRFDCAKSIKIKAYETIDAILLGIYLHKKEDGITETNLKGALLGLYDGEHDCYLPVCKVNLDPEGVQIKKEAREDEEEGKKEKLIKFNKELVEILKDAKEDPDSVITLYETYKMEAKKKLECYLQDAITDEDITSLFDEMPRGHDFRDLLTDYNRHRKDYEDGLGTKKSHSKKDRWIQQHKQILSVIDKLKEFPKLHKEVLTYFSRAGEINTVSKKLIKPQLRLDTTEPIIIEAKVFDIKWSLNPMAAGFHSWYCNSFKFNNCFAERIRYDKASTTDYKTIYEIARANTVRRKNNADSLIDT